MNHWMPLGLHVTLVVNFVKIATMFANLDFLEKKSLVDYFFGIGPCSCQKICIIICSFNLSKFMKSCRANLPFLYWVSPKKVHNFGYALFRSKTRYINKGCLD